MRERYIKPAIESEVFQLEMMADDCSNPKDGKLYMFSIVGGHPMCNPQAGCERQGPTNYL